MIATYKVFHLFIQSRQRDLSGAGKRQAENHERCFFLRPLNNHQHISPLLLYTCKTYVWTTLRSYMHSLGYCIAGSLRTPAYHIRIQKRPHPRVDTHVSMWNLPASFWWNLTCTFPCWKPILIYIKNGRETRTSEMRRACMYRNVTISQQTHTITRRNCGYRSYHSNERACDVISAVTITINAFCTDMRQHLVWHTDTKGAAIAQSV